MYRLLMVLAVLFAAALPAYAHSPEEAMALGEKFMDHEEWYRAATLFEETALEATGETAARAWLRAADAHQSARQYEKAAQLYGEAVAAGGSTGALAEVRIGQSYYLAKKYTLAQRALEGFERRHPQSDRVNEAIAYRAVANLSAGDFFAASQEYKLLAARATDATEKSAWQGLARDTLTQTEEKSLRLAALFSTLLPGAGQIYTGYYGEAAMAFGVNAIFGLLFWDAWLKAKDNSEHPNRGWDYTYPAIIGTLAAPFYIGNIYGAAVSAQRYNRKQVDTLRQGLKDRTVRLRVLEIPLE